MKKKSWKSSKLSYRYPTKISPRIYIYITRCHIVSAKDVAHLYQRGLF